MRRESCLGTPSWSVFDEFRPPEVVTRSTTPSWSIFDGFERPRRRISWELVSQFVEHGHRFAAERCRAFPSLLWEWDAVLDDLEGDPCRGDWSHFRPLRTDREEDWSDWLQHFISTSSAGTFCFELFREAAFPSRSSCARPAVLREDVIDDRRADLVIVWASGCRTHVEVKVGDQSFAKTAETAAKLERKYGGAGWSHYILLPSHDVERWTAIDHPPDPVVRVVTWDDVAVALRRSMRSREEGRRWRMWAHGFCGLIEQRLLGHPRADTDIGSMMRMARRVHQIAIMRRGLDHV